jgi:hypothetical protein
METKACGLCIMALVHSCDSAAPAQISYVERTWVLGLEDWREHVFAAIDRCHSHGLGVTVMQKEDPFPPRLAV